MNKIRSRFLNRLLLFYVLASSFFVMYEWIFRNPLFFINTNKEIFTKFNTAFLLFLSALVIVFYQRKTKNYKIFANIIGFILFFFSVLNIFQFVLHQDFNTDNLMVTDTFSKNLPGRMSLITSFCFVFYSIGIFSINYKKKWVIKFAQNIFLFGPILVLLNIISVVLLSIVGTEKVDFLKTMPLSTSLSFVIIFYLLLLLFPNVGFKRVLFGNSLGSKILRKSIPFVTFIPLLVGYIMLIFTEKDLLSATFAIILYTITLILTAFISIYFTSLNINKSYQFRKNAEKNLVLKNEELEQFKYALDQVAIIVIFDKNYIIKFVNKNFCDITKFSEEEVIGKTNSIIRSDEHSNAFFDELWNTISSGKPWFGEIKNKTKDGNYFWTSTSIVPLIKRENHIDEYITIKLDITKKKESEALLASSYVKKLEQKNKELEQFSYITSHDLQEPLRTISSFYEILNTEYKDKFDDDAKQIFKFIKSASNRMSELIKNLLDYSRIGYSEELRAVDINFIIRAIKTDLNSLILLKNATILYDNLPTIKVYPNVMRLLFQSLISNGLKFSKKDVAPIINISAEQKNNNWEFSIKDNGIGIAEEHQKKIFAIFQKLHLKEEYEGTGIGLAHCQKIVGLHDGEIWVKSKPNEGSTFYFTIPNK